MKHKIFQYDLLIHDPEIVLLKYLGFDLAYQKINDFVSIDNTLSFCRSRLIFINDHGDYRYSLEFDRSPNLDRKFRRLHRLNFQSLVGSKLHELKALDTLFNNGSLSGRGMIIDNTHLDDYEKSLHLIESLFAFQQIRQDLINKMNLTFGETP
jgi:hypothetical protein